MIFGTQVREEVDVAKNVMELPREAWIDSLSGLYDFHRSFSWLLVLFSGTLLYYNRKFAVTRRLHILGWAVFVMIILQMFVGIGMEWFSMPGALQVIHLVGIAVLICAELLYMLIVGFSK